MLADQILEPLITDGRMLRLVEPGIYSVFPADRSAHHYDNGAAFYDAVVGSSWYNRLIWGNAPHDYARFAAAAVTSAPNTVLLDAGCGSMVFTAAAYAASTGIVVAVDQSIGMLRRARRRLQHQIGALPNRIFLQADLLDLPFRPAQFQTVLCMGMLHLFPDLQPVLNGLLAVCRPGGKIYLTSLVQNARPADRYLQWLYQAGELAQPRRGSELEHVLAQELGQLSSYYEQGNMAYAVAQKEGRAMVL